MGNLGHAESTCVHQYLKLTSSINLNCKKGKISKMNSYGLMPDDKQKVSKQFMPDVCGNKTDYKSINECTDNWLYTDKL